jgi:phosphoribosylformylglycinamidine synthase
VADVIRDLVAAGGLGGIHDVSSGGVGVALAEMAVRSGVGFRVSGVDDGAALFSEAPSRVVLAVAPDRVGDVRSAADTGGVAVTELGEAGGDRLVFDGLVDVDLGTAVTAWRDRLPTALGSGVAQG